MIQPFISIWYIYIFSWQHKYFRNFHCLGLDSLLQLCTLINMFLINYIHGPINSTGFQTGVDKARNMEHPGTFRNMKKLKYFFMKKKLIN